jgi:hypothetical protein
MRRRIVIALLALGTVVGYGSGIAHAVRWHHAHEGHCSGWHHDSDRHQDTEK